MCDEIDPKHVWQKNVWFPRLRDKRLVESDFFAEDKEGFRTEEERGSYDLVVGNAPWGRDEVTQLAKDWAGRDQTDAWPIQYKSPGPLFLVKGACLVKESGYLSMVQPAQALLTNRQTKAMNFRKRSQFLGKNFKI